MSAMSGRGNKNDSWAAGGRGFATTHWSIVAAAGRRASASATQALATLCETYWYPLYAYVRRRGHDADEARDLTQEFFTHLLEKDGFRIADRARGKFRSFLLAALNHFLAREWRKAAAQKRGGGKVLLSLDVTTGEQRYLREPFHELTPERVYERRWALILMETALGKLRDEYTGTRRALFDALRIFLTGAHSGVAYAEAAKGLDMTEAAVKTAVHRLRRRCRELLRQEVAQTLTDPTQVDEELRDLFTAVEE